jgi:ubiquinone biosynthesis protein UbiJ
MTAQEVHAVIDKLADVVESVMRDVSKLDRRLDRLESDIRDLYARIRR